MPKSIVKTSLLKKHHVYLVGGSGGPDSMALLDNLVKKGFCVVVAHVNYHARRSANRDMRMVKEYCEKYAIPFVVKDVHFKKGNFEAWAREVRYAWFEELIQENQLDGVILGHQEDDLFETYWMQKESKKEYFYYGLREKGKVGKMMVYRPMLSSNKQDCLSYCEKYDVPYGLDETNEEDFSTRNRLRKKLSRATDKDKEKWKKEMEKQNETLWKRQESLRKKAKCLHPFQQTKYKSYSESVRLGMIRQYLMDQGVEEAFHYSLGFLTQLDKQLFSPKNQRMKVGKDWLWDLDYGVLTLHPKICPFSYSLKKKEYRDFGRISVRPKGKKIEGISLSKKDFPLTIRNGKSSDEISLRYGRKKLNRFWIDRKIPLWKRESWPVVENHQGKVIWIYGLGCDVDHYSEDMDFYIQIEK